MIGVPLSPPMAVVDRGARGRDTGISIRIASRHLIHVQCWLTASVLKAGCTKARKYSNRSSGRNGRSQTPPRSFTYRCLVV